MRPVPFTTGWRSRERSDDEGLALVVVLMATSLLSALGLALILTTMVERKIAGSFAQGVEAFYAADAALERALQDLLALPDWTVALAGAATSTFVDGPPSGRRPGPGGRPFDLTAATSVVRCGKPACTNAELVATTEDRPWGFNNPIWQPFAYGPLDGMLPAGRVHSWLYVVVWVGDDASENDDDPLRDGGLPVGCDPVRDPDCAAGNLGRGRLMLRATAFGPDGIQRSVEAAVGRLPVTGILAWRDVR